MSSRVDVYSTQFTDRDGTQHYGFCIADDYANAYDNCNDWDDFPKDTKQAVRRLFATVVGSMIRFLRVAIAEYDEIHIDGVALAWDEVREMLGDQNCDPNGLFWPEADNID